MKNDKVIIHAELTLRPEFLAEVLAVAATSLALTLQEEGCELLMQTRKVGEPNTLVLFEVFKSREAHDWHLAQAYSKAFFAVIEGKLAGEPTVYHLEEF